MLSLTRSGGYMLTVRSLSRCLDVDVRYGWFIPDSTDAIYTPQGSSRLCYR